MPLPDNEIGNLLDAFTIPDFSRAKAIFENLEKLHGKIDVNKIYYGFRLIIDAASSFCKDSAKMVEFLLEKGAAINVVDSDTGNTLLMIALERNDYELYRVLMNHLKTLKPRTRSSILNHRNLEKEDVLKLAIAASIDLEGEQGFAMVKELLEQGE